MNRKSHRVVWVALALILCLSLVASALAEGPLRTLYGAATRLLFDTDNATLQARATFAYEGKPFKTVEGSYTQDGENSLLNVRKHTPRADGTTFVHGYTVIGQGETAYAIDPMNNPFIYTANSQRKSSAILSGTALRGAVLRFGAAAAGAMEGPLADHITVNAQSDGSTQYHFALKEGDAPALINAAGTLLAQVAAARLYDIDYDLFSEASEPACRVVWENYHAQFDAVYEKLYGEKKPVDFEEKLWGADGKALRLRRQTVIEQLSALYNRLQKEYHSGIAEIAADGSVKHYDTTSEWMRAKGNKYVTYEDSLTTFRHYYQQKTGTPLSARELSVIMASSNEALKAAFTAMMDEMTAEYRAQLEQHPQAVIVDVSADGAARFIEDVDAFNHETRYRHLTVKNQILYTMRSLELGETNAVITLDSQNRFAAAKGTATILVVDETGAKHPLAVEFDLSADSYGASSVAPFDPAAYGVTDWETYAAEHKDEPVRYYMPSLGEEFVPMPDTFTFNGVTYDLTDDGSGAPNASENG